jgi:hypothetical protein
MVNAMTPDGKVPENVDAPDAQTIRAEINAYLANRATQGSVSVPPEPGA